MSRSVAITARSAIKTIWSHSAILPGGPLYDVQPRFRVYGRIVFPIIYSVVIAGLGVYGSIQGGSATVTAQTFPWYSHALCGAAGLGGVFGLLGLVFDHKRLESAGDTMVMVFVGAYLWLLFSALGTGNGAPILAMTTAVIVVALLAVRIIDLMNQIEQRKGADVQ